MKTYIKAKIVLTDAGEASESAVLIEGGIIQGIVPHHEMDPAIEVLDYSNAIVSPGFIDVHVHGANGFDAMDGTYEAIDGISKYLISTGTTGFLVTTVTASDESIIRAIHATKESKEKGVQGAAVLGVHLEGPYINQKKKGAQNGEFVRNPDAVELKKYADLLGDDFKMITLAPELDEDFAAIKLAKERGAVISAGHSCCTFEEANAAIDAGVSHATHLFNGMDSLHHRNPGLVGAILSNPKASAEIIADNIHLHPGIMNVVLAAKGIDKTLLVTDCMRAGNLDDGIYDLGGLTVHVSKGVARLEEGSLAGSTLRMVDAVKNMVNLCHVPLCDAVHLASLNPARLIGIGNKKGSIEPGKDADLTIFTSNFDIVASFVNGELRYKK